MPSRGELRWWGVPVFIKDSVPLGVFHMSLPDDDPGQKPAFIVSQETADSVTKHFGRYRAGLGFQVSRWQAEKKQLLEALARDDIPPTGRTGESREHGL